MALHAAYASRSVTINYSGVLFETGKGDDVWLNVSRSAPRASFRAGADGNHSASISPDRSGTVVLSYFAESNSAKIMQAIYSGLQADGDTLGAVPLAVTDPSGSIIFGADQAVLSEVGDAGYSTDTPVIDFTFFVPDLTVITLPADLAAEVNSALSTLGVSA